MNGNGIFSPEKPPELGGEGVGTFLHLCAQTKFFWLRRGLSAACILIVMHVLILGGGGREHALAWKIAQSPICTRLSVAPGNAGTATVATNVPLSPDDFAAIGDFCRTQAVQLVVVGPEAPLVAGIRDYFVADDTLRDVAVLGPDRAAARLEGSKDFAKQFMQRHGIPTAASQTFTADQLSAAEAYLQTLTPPYVLKADGLAAGKGVVITSELAEAVRVLRAMLIGRQFGQASARVVIETFLDGVELSVFVLTDGQHYHLLPEAKDYKRIGEGDQGPNTGGMGAVSPVPFADAAFLQKVTERVVVPTLRGLQAEQMDYRGFLFIGLMKVGDDPYVIEYNVRMGDPETQAVLPRIATDLLPALHAAAQGRLTPGTWPTDPRTAVTVVLAAGGYPGAYEKGYAIAGLDALPTDVLAFHAGTRATPEGIATDGGRVLALTALADVPAAARAAARRAAEGVTWSERYFRRDIGQDVLGGAE